MNKISDKRVLYIIIALALILFSYIVPLIGWLMKIAGIVVLVAGLYMLIKPYIQELIAKFNR